MREAAMTPGTGDSKLMNAIILSLVVGIGMLVMKVTAYVITGSAAIFSDAAESVVHNVGVLFALFSLVYSRRPADKTHLYGHEKIGFFSAGFEGALIALAACVILYAAVRKWLTGLRIEHLDTGILFTVAATVINGLLGFFLIWRGRKYNSLIIEANGKHVLTDGWTSLGVIVGLVLARVTGWLPFDPICAILVGLNILWTGGDLVRRSFGGLMDKADPEIDRQVRAALDAETAKLGLSYHELKHRTAGNTTWVEVHLLFPGHTQLRQAHEQATQVERAVEAACAQAVRVTTHLEAVEDHEQVHRNASA
jgi:cation diffusion facilitator family transporter